MFALDVVLGVEEEKVCKQHVRRKVSADRCSWKVV